MSRMTRDLQIKVWKLGSEDEGIGANIYVKASGGDESIYAKDSIVRPTVHTFTDERLKFILDVLDAFTHLNDPVKAIVKIAKEFDEQESEKDIST